MAQRSPGSPPSHALRIVGFEICQTLLIRIMFYDIRSIFGCPSEYHARPRIPAFIGRIRAFPPRPGSSLRAGHVRAVGNGALRPSPMSCSFSSRASAPRQGVLIFPYGDKVG